MQVTCDNCGSDRFKAGYIENNPEGGYDVLMPCAECGQPKLCFTEYDPGLARDLMRFFSSGEEAS